MATTTHLGITLLETAQAQKEITINEAFARIDAILNTGIIDKDLATPPGTPLAGDSYIIAADATGDWAGKSFQIAYFDQIWRFIVPNRGLLLWVNDENVHYIYNGSVWQMIVISTGGSGDMTKALYDPANINQQLVGVDATQTLTNKTLTAPKFSTIVNTGTLTLPTSTDTLVGRATTDTLTNKTLTAPIIRGRTTATAAAAGNVGEVISSTLALGSATALTTAVGRTVTSISCTAGWWDIEGLIVFTSTATTSFTLRSASLSLVNNTSGTFGDMGHAQQAFAANVPAGLSNAVPTGRARYYFSATTTVYLVAITLFTVSTSTAHGTIIATRVQA